MSCDRSESTRQAYLRDLAQFGAKQLVFLDKTIFDKKTDWRRKVYAPISKKARWETLVKCGKIYNCLAVIGIEGWLLY